MCAANPKFVSSPRTCASASVLAAVILFTAPATSHAQPEVSAEAVVDTRPEPAPPPPYFAPSLRFGLGIADDVPFIAAPAVDMDQVRAEDAQARAAHDRRLRFGVWRNVWLSPAMGRWDAVPGGRVWRADITSVGADGLRVHFMNVALPVGAELAVYSLNDPARVYGPFTGRGMLDSGEFWAPTCFGDDTVRIEYFEPRPKPGAAAAAAPFVIDALQHIYRDPITVAAEQGLLQRVGPCHTDVTCQAAWANVALAVGGIGTIGQTGTLFCSGQLLATTAADLTPYFLTANHCVGTQAVADTAEVYWRYQTSSCNGTVPAIGTVPRSGPCTLVATNNASASSDYALLMVEGGLPSGLAWAGWTSAEVPFATPSACVQHPAGSWKRIATGSNLAGHVCANSNFVQVHWNTGVTEDGSSGAGLFRSSDQKLYGQLYCGFSACNGTVGNGLNDEFGRFSISFLDLANYLAAGSDDGFEPNNTCLTARLMPPAIYNGLVVKSTAEDWYKMTIPANQRLTVTLNFVHANGNIDAQLFTACGSGAFATSASTSNTETLSFQNSGTPRDVWVRVYLTGTDTRNSYSMTVNTGSTTGISNDACANAQPLALNSQFFATTTGATVDGSSGCGADTLPNAAPDVWYSFTPAAPGLYRFDTPNSTLDTVLSLHSACPGTVANQLGCNDDATPGMLTSQLDLYLNAATTYYIRIAGYNTDTGAFNIRVTQLPITPPSNDNCANAPAIGNGSILVSNIGATTDGPDEPASCAFNGDPAIAADVWYRYNAVCTGTVSVDTCGGATFNTELAVYGATCPSSGGSVIACNDDNAAICGAGSTRSALTFTAINGQQYLIRLGGVAGAYGSATLTISCAAAPLGSCCVADGSCTSVAQFQCAAGAWTLAQACSPNPCPQPTGTCCDSAGCCTITQQSACSAAWTIGGSCTPVPCVSAQGSCCIASGACTVTSLCACNAVSGGVWTQSASCAPNPCPQPSGACCCGANCAVTDPAACTGTGRVFAGSGSACMPFSLSAPCCRGDYNKSGGPITVQDIFDFITGYFSSDLCADANDSGAVTVQDIFDYLSAYFGGC